MCFCEAFCWFIPWTGSWGHQQSTSEGAGRAAGPCGICCSITKQCCWRLYSPGEGRELFDFSRERRVPADEHESYGTMQQMEVIRYFHPTFFCLWGIQPFQDHNDSQKGHSLNFNVQYWWRGKIIKKKDHRQKCKLEVFFFLILAQKGCSKKPKSSHMNSIVLPDIIPGETKQDFSTICAKKLFYFSYATCQILFQSFSFIFHALRRSFLLCIFSSGSSSPPPCLFATSLRSSLQLVPVYQIDVGLL